MISSLIPKGLQKRILKHSPMIGISWQKKKELHIKLSQRKIRVNLMKQNTYFLLFLLNRRGGIVLLISATALIPGNGIFSLFPMLNLFRL